jgi:hypothetical protein
MTFRDEPSLLRNGLSWPRPLKTKHQKQLLQARVSSARSGEDQIYLPFFTSDLPEGEAQVGHPIPSRGLVKVGELGDQGWGWNRFFLHLLSTALCLGRSLAVAIKKKALSERMHGWTDWPEGIKKTEGSPDMFGFVPSILGGHRTQMFICGFNAPERCNKKSFSFKLRLKNRCILTRTDQSTRIALAFPQYKLASNQGFTIQLQAYTS